MLTKNTSFYPVLPVKCNLCAGCVNVQDPTYIGFMLAQSYFEKKIFLNYHKYEIFPCLALNCTYLFAVFMLMRIGFKFVRNY